VQSRHFASHRASSRLNFDHFLDVIERRVFRVAMLIVLLLWLGEKVRDTAVASHLADFASRPRVEAKAPGPCQATISPPGAQ
jgi:hypothetical protein